MHDPKIAKIVVAIFLSIALLTSVVYAQTDTRVEVETPKTIFIVPFLNVMVPDTYSTTLFDSFVDQLISFGDQHDIKIRILKQDIGAVDKEWLGQQFFITGETFGYLEDSGCCSTEIEVKARIYSYRPGSVEPDQEIVVPDDTFFDHDVTTLEKERVLLARRMAQELAMKFLSSLVLQ